MALKDELEAMRLENEALMKELEDLKSSSKKAIEITSELLKEVNEIVDVKEEEMTLLKKDIESLENIPKHKLIKLLNKELGSERNRLTTDFLSGIELLTRSIRNLGGGE